MKTGRDRAPYENPAPEILTFEKKEEISEGPKCPDNPTTDDAMRYLGLSRGSVLRLVTLDVLHPVDTWYKRPFTFSKAELEALKIQRTHKKKAKANQEEAVAKRRETRRKRNENFPGTRRPSQRGKSRRG